jgi:shikimate dehydrogenase
MAYEWREAPAADFAVIGNPVSHSLSPPMHQAIYRTLQLPYRYVALRVEAEEVSTALDFLVQKGYLGVNVTVPHKREALEWAKEIEPFAREVGSANTVDLVNRSCINTDAPGFIKTLGPLQIQDKTVLVLGAGGSARALVAILAKRGWNIKIYNRTVARAQELAEHHGSVRVVEAPDPNGVQLILNTTSASFDGEAPPVLWDRASLEAVAYDLMYSKTLTPFLTEANQRGLRLVDGIPLLVAQGALSFEWWTGLKAPEREMESALRERL